MNRVAELDSIFPKKYLPLHRAMSPAREIYVPRSRPKSIFDDPLRAYGYNYAGKVWLKIICEKLKKKTSNSSKSYI